MTDDVRRRQQVGFTLIELMIVIAIIGVLAGIALPQYQAYAKQAKFSEVIRATSERKTAVSICAQETGLLDSCSGNGNPDNYPGIPLDDSQTGTNIANITTLEGEITVTTTQELDGLTYTLKAILMDSALSWNSSGTCIDAGLC